MRGKIYWKMICLFGTFILVNSFYSLVSRVNRQSLVYLSDKTLISILNEYKGIKQIVVNYGGNGVCVFQVIVRQLTDKLGDEVLLGYIDTTGKWRVAYRMYYYGEFVRSVTPWVAPTPGWDVNGYMIITRGGAGKNYRLVILADIKGTIQPVINLIGSGGEKSFPEFVDMDNDGYQEIVHTPDWWRYYGDEQLAFRKLQAEIWKWNASKSKYVLLKKVPWLQRLGVLRKK